MSKKNGKKKDEETDSPENNGEYLEVSQEEIPQTVVDRLRDGVAKLIATYRPILPERFRIELETLVDGIALEISESGVVPEQQG